MASKSWLIIFICLLFQCSIITWVNWMVVGKTRVTSYQSPSPNSSVKKVNNQFVYFIFVNTDFINFTFAKKHHLCHHSIKHISFSFILTKKSSFVKEKKTIRLLKKMVEKIAAFRNFPSLFDLIKLFFVIKNFCITFLIYNSVWTFQEKVFLSINCSSKKIICVRR